MSDIKLTAKQEMFCKEYLIDLNGAQAAIRAGYSKDSARIEASRLLTNDNIQQYLQELKAKREEKLEINALWVLNQAVKVHNRCMEEKELMTEFNGKERVPLKNESGEYLYKFDSTGALKALDLIGKHINIKAFDKSLEHNHKGFMNLEVTFITAESPKSDIIIDNIDSR
jgi:phage terminase small subunit